MHATPALSPRKMQKAELSRARVIIITLTGAATRARLRFTLVNRGGEGGPQGRAYRTATIFRVSPLPSGTSHQTPADFSEFNFPHLPLQHPLPLLCRLARRARSSGEIIPRLPAVLRRFQLPLASCRPFATSSSGLRSRDTVTRLIRLDLKRQTITRILRKTSPLSETRNLRLGEISGFPDSCYFATCFFNNRFVSVTRK